MPKVYDIDKHFYPDSETYPDLYLDLYTLPLGLVDDAGKLSKSQGMNYILSVIERYLKEVYGMIINIPDEHGNMVEKPLKKNMLIKKKENGEYDLSEVYFEPLRDIFTWILDASAGLTTEEKKRLGQ